MHKMAVAGCFLSLLACRPLPIAITGTLPVAVVAAPRPIRTCSDLPEMPNPPDKINLDLAQPDVIVRTTVHIGDYNAMQQWMSDMTSWALAAATCIDHLSGADQ